MERETACGQLSSDKVIRLAPKKPPETEPLF